MKNRFIACIAVLLLCSLASAAVGAPSPIYETTGILEDFEENDYNLFIVLLVNGKPASGPVAADCRFYLNNTEVDLEAFYEQALGNQVTVEFHGKNAEISKCTAIILRHE